MNIFLYQGGARRPWAEATCKVLIEGSLFEQCRLRLSGEENLYYEDCKYDGCG